MFREYYTIDTLEISDKDKKKLRNFAELLDKHEEDKLNEFSMDDLRYLFELSKASPKLQIEMWRTLPEKLANNIENSKIFEDVLENKFGEYIQAIDKRALVQLLNSSRYPSRSN